MASEPKLIAASTAEIVSLDLAKLHCRVDGDVEDALLSLMIAAAVQECADVMQRAITPATYRAEFDGFADAMTLKPATATEVVSVQYIDANGATQTLALTEVKLSGGVLSPAYGKTWPATRAEPGSVTITYKSSTWDDAASVPASVKAWILLRIGALYENREAWTHGQEIQKNEHLNDMLGMRRFTL